MREQDWTWLTACMGVVEGDMNPGNSVSNRCCTLHHVMVYFLSVEAYLNSGGEPTRKLNAAEVILLNRSNVYEPGHTLVHLAIKYGYHKYMLFRYLNGCLASSYFSVRFHREDMLAKLLSRLECGHASSGIKCVPSYVAPDLASGIRRNLGQSFRQRKGPFPCYYLTEWATYSLPPG